MIGISKLYCGQVEPSDALRYGRHSGKLPSHLLQFSANIFLGLRQVKPNLGVFMKPPTVRSQFCL